jgi:hypothetical protein
MAGSKTETAVRYPQSADQKRRLRHVTQDRKWEARMRERAVTAPEMSSNATSWPPETLLELNMDDEGNPVPDPAQYSDGAKAIKHGLPPEAREQDMVAAANEVP